ncbi:MULTISPECIES: RES family NAD+ phosphorylase [unclassified Nonomuraea]|uniref:RES family NAD+ phosphorylase n=1 Tax=unclassified Nonomuraea TaxID=2593643 RepID=UPI0033C2D021
MTASLPPDMCPGVATTDVLPQGTRLWRVHSVTREAHEFNPLPANHKIGGGRFDSTSLRFYPYLYAAAEKSTALMETIVRSLLFDKTGGRAVVRAVIKKLRLSAIELTRDVRVLILADQQDLSGICATEWLVHAEAVDYDLTRRWAMWVHGRDWREQGRGWPGAPQGMVWQAKRDSPRHAMMFFGDRCADAIKTVPGEGFLLSDNACYAELSRLLLPYGVAVNPPTGGHRP